METSDREYLHVVPTPAKQSIKEDAIHYSEYKAAISVANDSLRCAAEVFAEYAVKLGVKFDIAAGTAAPHESQIRLLLNAQFKPGEYSLKADGESVILSVSDDTGAGYAFATLLQIMELPDNAVNTDKSLPCNTVLVPDCEIEDAPECSYRGMLVDLARSWHNLSYLYRYVDMCWYYKVPVLHLHFTDDQSYTLPSRLFPRVSTHGRSYTFDEMQALDEYAYARGVRIMPEIDVPGHCAAFQKEYPEIFGNDGIICQNQEAIEAMQELFKELCDIFPHADKIHIGGDEANIKKWLECPRCMEYARSIGIDTESGEHKTEDLLYVNFVVKMAEAVFSTGRTPVVWEGFPEYMNDRIPRDMLVMSWENYFQLTPSLLNAGFTIINCSWNPMYIVTPEPVWPPQELYDWSIYKWMPVHPESPLKGIGYKAEPTEQIIGGQLLAWGDRLPGFATPEEGADAELALLKERIPYLAENTWNREKKLPFETIEQTVKYTNARLDKILSVRI